MGEHRVFENTLVEFEKCASIDRFDVSQVITDQIWNDDFHFSPHFDLLINAYETISLSSELKSTFLFLFAPNCQLTRSYGKRLLPNKSISYRHFFSCYFWKKFLRRFFSFNELIFRSDVMTDIKFRFETEMHFVIAQQKCLHLHR